MSCNETEDDDSDLEQAMGFMFDSSHARSCLSFSPAGCLAPIRLRMIKGDPGHVQSGQYLWPAAQFAAGWLFEHRSDPWLAAEQLHVVELGAGCGLAGLALAQLPNVASVCLTDYDYGSLALLQENADEAKTLDCFGDGEKNLLVARVKWGAPLPPLISSICAENSNVLVVGTDLIYSQDVIQPLLQTAQQLLRSEGGGGDASLRRFVLFSSFDISDYDSEVARACHELKLDLREVSSLDLDSLPPQARVQTFSLMSL